MSRHAGLSRPRALAVASALAALVAGCGDDAPATSGPAQPAPAETALDPEAAALLGQALEAMRGRRWEEVGPILQPLLERPSPPPDATWIAGSAAFELGRFTEAVERLDDAVRRKPAFLPNAAALGFARRELGDFAGAEATFQQILAVRPTAYKAHYGLGLVALDQGRLPEARRELVATLELEPHYLKAHAALGRLLFEEGRHEEARAELERVVDSWPGNEQALYLLAQAQSALGDQDAADATLARRAQVYAIKEQLGAFITRRRSGEPTAAEYAQEVYLHLEIGETSEASRTLALGLRAYPDAPELMKLVDRGLASPRAIGAADAADAEPDDGLQR